MHGWKPEPCQHPSTMEAASDSDPLGRTPVGGGHWTPDKPDRAGQSESPSGRVSAVDAHPTCSLAGVPTCWGPKPASIGACMFEALSLVSLA